MKVTCLSNGCVPYVEGYLPSQVKQPDHEIGTWELIQEEPYIDYFCNVPGQHEFSEFGKHICSLLKENDGPKTWVEIGTWNGRGTTQCLLRGLTQREIKDGVQIVSYEADPFFYKTAKKNLENNQFFDSFFFLYHGRLPCELPFINEKEILETDKDESSHYHLYFEREKQIYGSAKQIQPPFSPEAVILDGGEYAGYFDWISIDKSNLQYVFLDDINVFKNSTVNKELEDSPDWTLFAENKQDRNGWAIFKRIPYA
jgi:hypothetical protein